jgi:hypothetical protein
VQNFGRPGVSIPDPPLAGGDVFLTIAHALGQEISEISYFVDVIVSNHVMLL